MAGITYIDYYIPGEELAVAHFLDSIGAESIPRSFKNKQEYAGFVDNVLNVKSIRIETGLDEASMIGGLIEKMFAAQDIKPEDIDVIIATQEFGYVTQDNIARRLQHKHKMGNAYVFHVSGNHCANIEMSVYLASSLLQTQQDIDNILIITSNKVETPGRRIFGTYALVGDAAGIMIMSRKNLDHEKYSLRLADNVFVSGSKLYDADVNDDNSIIHCVSYVKCISDLIKKNALSNGNVEKILIQNANPLMITQCMASAGLDKNKIFTKNLGKYGHMNYVDFVINMKDIVDEGIVDRDRYIFTFGTGHTGSYASCLFSLK